VKTNTKGFPRDAIRHALHGAPRGTHVVFEERDEHDEKTGTRAIGWNGHWHEGFITNCGPVAAGKPANKRRQRTGDSEDGRNDFMPAPRPSNLEHCCEIAGYVDRHNRCRQSMLRLQKTLKTKNWATRVQLEVLGTAVVDACLTYRMLMPKWRDRGDSESNFQAFVNVAVLQVDGRTEEQLDLEEQLAQAASPTTTQTHVECALVSGPRAGVRSSGAAHAKMQRCFHCKKEKRHNKEGRSHPTSYHCRAHPEHHVFNVETRPCMQEHLDHVACLT
jgi:hypothetical protein